MGLGKLDQFAVLGNDAALMNESAVLRISSRDLGARNEDCIFDERTLVEDPERIPTSCSVSSTLIIRSSNPRYEKSPGLRGLKSSIGSTVLLQRA